MRNGWGKASISQLANVVTGKTPPTSDRSNYGSFLPFVSPADLGEFKYISSSEKYLSKKGSEKARILPVGTCLFTCIGSTIGKVGVSAIELTTNQQINAAIAKNGVCGEYLYYSLCDIAPKIKKLAGVQAVPIINKTEFENQILWIPLEIAEQKAIADLLSTWDEAIEKTQRLIQAKEKRFYALLSKLISDNGQLTTGKSDWKKVKLGAVCKVITSNVDKKTLQNETLVRLCNYMDVYKNFYITSAIDFMEASATTSEILKFHLKKDDVLLTKDSETPDDIANSACVIEDLGSVLCGYHLSILRPMQRIEGAYLNFALHTPRIRYEFSRQANGATRFGLTMQAYNMVEIPLPPLEEQKQIAETLSTAQQEIDLLKHLAEKYKTQKRGLMQKMLTGEWRIKPEILTKYKEA
ncbi:MAG: restriction endonuclease subunit S [Candidatus Omnitrophica bacterium]|nr:restriction endonuclease subunit S [Candidatus Omnitrophota bacterium]